MTPFFIRLMVVFGIAFAALAALEAKAGALSASETEKVQAVIATQLEAFALDDADRAFDTATPEVRQAIGSSGRFLALVRGAYPMVFRPSSITFHNAEAAQGTALQLVEIRDKNQKSWLALFALEQQPDATWRISGCIVAENHWRAT